MDINELLNSLLPAFDQPLSTIILKIVVAILVLIIGGFISKAITRMEKNALQRSNVEPTLISFLGKLTYISLLLIVVVISLGILGFPVTSIIAILGAATLAIGLALQDSINNLASGVIIIALRPFVIGDYVDISDESGFVEDIRFFHTLLTTRDNKAVYIPNKDVMGGNITNYTKTDLIRLDLVFGIGYGDDVASAKKIVLEVLESDERVASQPHPRVAVKELGDNSVNLIALPYVKAMDGPEVSYSVTEQVKLQFDKAGISIPFPQRDVHLFQTN